MSQCHALLTETLGSMCEFMLKQTKERNMPWLLMMANNTLVELHKLRYNGSCVIGPILWGHSGPLCYALSLLSSSLLCTSMRRRRATVATPGEWQCGVWRLAVANGPNIFQMLLVK